MLRPRPWKHRIDVADAWKTQKFKAVATSAKQQLGRLQSQHFNDDSTLAELIDELEAIAHCWDSTVDDFDDVWGQLYDWADRERVWLGTV